VWLRRNTRDRPAPAWRLATQRAAVGHRRGELTRREPGQARRCASLEPSWGVDLARLAEHHFPVRVIAGCPRPAGDDPYGRRPGAQVETAAPRRERYSAAAPSIYRALSEWTNQSSRWIVAHVASVLLRFAHWRYSGSESQDCSWQAKASAAAGHARPRRVSRAACGVPRHRARHRGRDVGSRE
jgi:hypothetical protein